MRLHENGKLPQRSIQDEHPEVPRYTVIPHEVWSVVEFVNGKSRSLGDGVNARLAFEMADALAKANKGMASVLGGAGFSLESNYSPYDPYPLRNLYETRGDSSTLPKTGTVLVSSRAEPEAEQEE